MVIIRYNQIPAADAFRIPQPNSVSVKLSVNSNRVRASKRLAGKKTNADTRSRLCVNLFNAQARAINGNDPSTRATDMIKAVPDSTAAFSHAEYRLMNEGLVMKNNHSESTQAVATTIMMTTTRVKFSGVLFFSVAGTAIDD